MSASTFEKTMADEYSAPVKARFDELGGRIFLVDYSKSCAAQALIALVTTKKYSSFLMIVENSEIANTYKKLLSPTLGEITVVDTEPAMDELLKGMTRSSEALHGAAEAFRNDHKNLIVLREDFHTYPILHRILARDTGKSGIFVGEQNGSYTFSDFLAACKYDFVAVDDIHAHLDFEVSDRDSKEEFEPGVCDKIEFMNKSYYTPLYRSYGRLKALAARAAGCVLLSDIVVDRDAVELFAALDLLIDKFSRLGMREMLTPAAANFSYDGAYGYDGACEMIYNAITYGRDEESIISACLQYTKGSAQKVPGDINSMRDHLTKEINYISLEDVFLRVMHAQMQRKFGGNCPAIDTVVNNMVSSYDEMALTFADMFFRNEIKGQLESGLSTSVIQEMSVTELGTLLGVFFRYGSYHRLDLAPERTRIMRIKRDDSGFEYFARRYAKNEIEDALCYAALGGASNDVLKCTLLKRLADGREAGNKIAFPLVLVTNRDKDARLVLSRKIKEILGEVNTSLNLAERAAGDKAVIVTSYAELRQTPDTDGIGSIVFFDTVADLVATKLLVAKAQRATKGNVYLFHTYGDMSGVLADEWQVDIKEEDRMLPFACREISLKHGTRLAYADIVGKIDRMYGEMLETVTNGSHEKAKALPAVINEMLVNFGTTATFVPELMQLDLEYAAKMGKLFDDVFRNTASVGNSGDHVIVQSTDYVAGGSNAAPARTVGKSEEAFFNVCTKMLRHECDLIHHNCADCADYKNFLSNSFEHLDYSLNEFFSMAKKYVVEMKDLKYQIDRDDIIHSHDDDEEKAEFTVENVEEFKKTAHRVAEEMKKAHKDMPNIFHVPYKDILALREAVYQTYRKILRKYYKSVMIIFSNSTVSAKNGLASARKAVKARSEA